MDPYSCTSPGCINLNLQLERRKLERSQTRLEARERCLHRYLARYGVERADSAVLSLLLNPVFEAVEEVYGTADALARLTSKDQVPKETCPYMALMEELDSRMKAYVRLSEGAVGEMQELMSELLGGKETSTTQIRL